MQILEDNIKIDVSEEINHKISKKLDVFYNPLMKFNRDISILFLKKYFSDVENFSVLLPMSGTGVRGLRILKELANSIVTFNDISKDAIDRIKTNLEVNNLNQRYFITNDDANIILKKAYNFDYIDIDPFGSPNPFLDSAFQNMRKGYVAVTATDTAPLCGTYKNACLRKYNSFPLRNENMHEIGLRILIRKCQVVASQYSKALIPIFSYSKDHYFRVFFEVFNSKKKTDLILKEHKYFLYCNDCFSNKISEHNFSECCNTKMQFAGPLYSGKLNNNEFVEYLLENFNDNSQEYKFINFLKNDDTCVGLFDIHKISKKLKLPSIPKMDLILDNLNAKRTSFLNTGVKVINNNINILDEIKKIL